MKLFDLFKPRPKTWTTPGGSLFPANSDFIRLASYVTYTDKPLTVPVGAWSGPGADGRPVFLDLATAPHALIAGATGSGKSVCINSTLCSLLAKNSPHRLQLWIADPKRVDYIKYKGLPHLRRYACTVDDIEAMLYDLRALMMHRYGVMQAARVENIADMENGDFPRHIFVFDELASMMGNREIRKRLSPPLQEIAMLGRAAGVHLIIATQRPTRDAIDGQLKANCPTRIAFKTASATDSRVILDQKGAELLQGKGDGLILQSDGNMYRFQGLYMPADQIAAVIDFWKKQV